MTPFRSDLLAAVAQAIVDSGYAVKPGDEINCRTRCASRAQAHALIAEDERINSYSRYTQMELINDVMYTFGVSRVNARMMISRARKSKRATGS